MAIFAAVLDACVMVPVALCDTLLRLAEERLYRPIWSERILAEATDAIGAIHPDIDSSALQRRVAYMNDTFPGACIGDFAEIEAGLQLPDPDDRHVVAAALRARADAVVTANLRDFPIDAMLRLDLEVISPDDFLMSQLDMRSAVVMEVLEAQAAATRNPKRSLDDVLTALAKAGVPGFVDEVRGRF